MVQSWLYLEAVKVLERISANLCLVCTSSEVKSCCITLNEVFQFYCNSAIFLINHLSYLHKVVILSEGVFKINKPEKSFGNK